MPRDSLVGSSRRCGWARKFAFRALTKTHRIGRPLCLENPRPEGAEYSLTESDPSPFHAEPEHSLAGVLGWLLAKVAAPALIAMVSTKDNPVQLALGLDGRVLFFCAF